MNPFYWLASRARPRPLYWRLLAIVGVVWVWGSVRFGADWFNEGVYFATAILLNCTFKSWVASEAGRHLGEQRKEGALEFLLCTPLSVKEILRGQCLAFRRQFLGPLLAIVTVQLIFLAASLQREPFHQNPIAPTLWVASILMLVADVIALCWAAMWAALTVKTPNRITGVTVTRLFFAPWLAFVAALIIAEVLRMPDGPDYTWKFYVGCWFVLGIVLDLAFGIGAWWVLHTRFRLLALQPFVPLSSQVVRFLSRIKAAITVRFLRTPELQSAQLDLRPR